MSVRPIPQHRLAIATSAHRIPENARKESRTPVLLSGIGLVVGCALIAGFLATLPMPEPVLPKLPVPTETATAPTAAEPVPVGWLPDDIPNWPVPAGDVPEEDGPNLRARAWYVVADESGEVLAAQNADRPYPIASITKLMGALVIADSGVVDDREVEITDADQHWIQVTRSHLRLGAKCRAKDLLNAGLVSSDNRAMAALMRTTGLRPEEFSARMNAKAQALGMKTAHFEEPTGLDPGNVASARDVAILLHAAAHHPVLAPLLGEAEYRFERLDRDVEMVARSSNAFTRNPTWDVLAAKTGYTDEALSCLAIRTSLVDGRKVTMALLGAPGGIGGRYAAASRARVWLEGGPRPEEIALAKAARERAAKEKAARVAARRHARHGRGKASVAASKHAPAKKAVHAGQKKSSRHRGGRTLSSGGR